MASFTAKRRAVGAALGHAVFECALVRVPVASGTSHILPAKWQDLVRTARCPCLVTVRARDRSMCSRQSETSVAMFRDGKSRAMEILNGMTAFTLVQVRSSSKLVVMGVFVAVQAGCELHFVDGVLASWEMALTTLNSDVLSAQGIAGGVVLLHAEERWLPALDRMAFRALTFLRSRFKLAFVRVGFVAVHTVRKGQRLFEIAVQMALGATHGGVLAE